MSGAISHDGSVSHPQDNQIGLVSFCGSQDRMYFISGDQFGIREQSGLGDLLFCLAKKRDAFLLLRLLPNVGGDGRHCK